MIKQNLSLYSLMLAWLIACLATFGSLYLEATYHLIPSQLCWFQRVCMFPLVPILGIALYRGNVGIIPYLYPQVALGTLFSFYHICVQEIPNFSPLKFLCGSAQSCSEKFNVGLGPISMPILSFLAFSSILLLYTQWNSKTRLIKI